jgi:ribosomal protein S16
MPVKIRLAQRGKKKNRTYRVVVADSRSQETDVSLKI